MVTLHIDSPVTITPQTKVLPQLTKVVTTGNLNQVRKLYEQYPTQENLNLNLIFCQSCQFNHFGVVQWL